MLLQIKQISVVRVVKQEVVNGQVQHKVAVLRIILCLLILAGQLQIAALSQKRMGWGIMKGFAIGNVMEIVHAVRQLQIEHVALVVIVVY